MTAARISIADPHPNLAELAQAIRTQLDRARTDLTDLVALPSIHGAEPEACDRAAELVRTLLADLPIPGLGPDAVEVIDTSDGSRAVFAHRPAAPGRATVLLYSHYDVQPAGELADWTASPWELTERDGRWYGRGAADCKGNLVVHLTALRALAAVGGAPVRVTTTTTAVTTRTQTRARRPAPTRWAVWASGWSWRAQKRPAEWGWTIS